MKMSRSVEQPKQQQSLALVCGMLAWCVGLVFFRIQRTGSEYFLFMIWNLFLACIPLFASRLLQIAHAKRIPDVVQIGLVAVWLAFLPNAPYVITDLIHLEPGPTRLYWFDLAMLLSCGAAGILLGYSSLFDVHRIVDERFGRRMGWGVASATLLLSGFGIYLGRVLRWNSWDVLTNPRRLFDSIAATLFNSAEYAQIWAISAFVGGALLFGYVTLHWLSSRRSLVVA
jgi:uncharacterized membrane protein